jgi:hypothetical protein
MKSADGGVLEYDIDLKDRRVGMIFSVKLNFTAPPSRSSHRVYLSNFTAAAAANRIYVKRLNSKDDMVQYLPFVFFPTDSSLLSFARLQLARQFLFSPCLTNVLPPHRTSRP